MRPFLFLLVLLLSLHSAQAQSVVVRAEVASQTISPDGAVNYAVIVAGEGTALVPTPSAPPTVGLAAVDPYPTTQADIAVVNGEARQSVVFRWTFRPVRSGRATVGPTVVRVGNRTYRTDPIDIEVAPGLAATPSPGALPRASRGDPTVDQSSGEDVFVRASPSRTSAWQGQQIVVEYRLYFDPNLIFQDLSQVGSWDTDGFWREELTLDPGRHPSLVALGGRRYASLVIKRVALFPTRSGTLTVSPFEVGGQALVPAGAVAGGTVRLRDRTLEVKATAPALTLDVRALPGGAPASFGGAVGAFSLDVTRPNATLHTGEAGTFEATIRGDGNLATLAAPTLVLPPGLDGYPPRPTLDLDRSGTRVSGRKTFGYTVLPLQPGAHRLPPVVFTSFDPETGRYVTQQGGGADIDATGPPIARSGAGAGAADTLALPRTRAVFAERTEPLHRRAWPYALLGLPALALLVLAGLRRVPVRRPAARRRIEATDALADARAHLSGRDAAPFYHALAHALERAAEARTGHSVRGLTRDALGDALLTSPPRADAPPVDALRSADVSRLRDVLHRADLARFATLPLDAAQRRADLAAAEALLAVLAPVRDAVSSGTNVAATLAAAALLLMAAPTATAQPAAPPPDRLNARLAEAVAARDVPALRRLAADTDDPDVLYSLGTVAASANEVPLAVWGLMRAQRLAPGDTLAARNLAVVRAATGLDSLALPRGDFGSALWTTLVRRIGPTVPFALGAALWWVAALLVAVRLRRRLTRDTLRRSLAVLLPGAALLIGVAVAASMERGLMHEAVAAQAVEVREQPSESSVQRQALPAGAVVELRPGGTALWAFVRTGEGQDGFVQTAHLLPLDAPLPTRP